ncbi:hypothetical protein F5Y14DRAFT_307488 [Nemania sp. NC0429]|nr:hypothetical protein F5Y14DRAFT_307488 [Nemania sp. NC0429]
MSVSKQRISSPLEAGRSILDGQNMPPHLTGALEYASKRIARKGLHISLIVVKNEYQLPYGRPCATPTSPPHTPEQSTSGFASPSRFTSPVAGLRQLVRKGTSCSLASLSSSSSSSSSASETAASTVVSPTFPPTSAEPSTSPRRWIFPLTPRSPLPSTPMTPHTPSSIGSMTTATSSSCATSYPFQNPERVGVRLVYASSISPKDEKMMRATITKAERKFRTGVGGLPAVTTAAACGLSADVIRRSIRQNEVLFSSEGLTLLGLDRLYSFKAALSAYAKSIATPKPHTQTSVRSPGLSNHPVNPTSPISTSATEDSSRLEDAVDCLRRLVLSNGDRPVSKASLYCSFDWMGVNPTALAEVERMYRRAYGGPERRGPFQVPPIPSDQEREYDREVEAKRLGFIKIGTPPPPKTQTPPVLRLNTNVTTTPRLVRPEPKPILRAPAADVPSSTSRIQDGAQDGNSNRERGDHVEELEIRIDSLELAVEKSNNDYNAKEDGDRTPHPLRDGPVRPSMFWPYGQALGTSINEMLSPCESRQSQQLGPMTPNGYDDISPITRGEWGFLFKGDAWVRGRTAVIETC